MAGMAGVGTLRFVAYVPIVGEVVAGENARGVRSLDEDEEFRRFFSTDCVVDCSSDLYLASGGGFFAFFLKALKVWNCCSK